MSRIAEYLKGKNVLILGYGREGQSTLAYLRRVLPEQRFAVADRQQITVADDNVDVFFGEDYLSRLGDYDVVIKSPGIPFLADVTWPETTEITCQTDLFLRFCDPVVVGVTGTKGKTTTSTLIHRMLRAGGVNAVLIGNIGVPVLEQADAGSDLVAVVEMSSHQLEFCHASPHVAVLLNLYQEHLDHYKNGYEGYRDAKLNIARFQGPDDYFIYDDTQETDIEIPWDDVAVANRLPNWSAFARDDVFINELWQSSEHLKGEFNRHDIAYAATAAALFGVDDDAIREAVRTFPGIEHRMEFVGKFGGVAYYNDSIATVPTSAIGAVNAIGNVGSHIFGGLDRGIDYTGFIEFLKTNDVPVLIGLPDTGYTICDALADSGKTLYKAADMEDAVRFAAAHTPAGQSCLFSPAAASYNHYKNFEEKGRHFKTLVRALGDPADAQS